MIDTPEEIVQKQREILLAKTPMERFTIGMETIRFGRQIVEDSIRQKHPCISEPELKVAVFRRCYENSFSPEELDLILESTKRYFSVKSGRKNPFGELSDP